MYARSLAHECLRGPSMCACVSFPSGVWVRALDAISSIQSNANDGEWRMFCGDLSIRDAIQFGRRCGRRANLSTACVRVCVA